MRKVLTVGVALVAALSLTACNGGAKNAPAGSAKTAAAAKPPLKIPAKFASIQDEVDFSVKAVNDGYYKETKPLLEEVVKSNPTAEVYESLATVRFNTGDYDGAITAWTKLAGLDSSRQADVKNNIGNALRMQGKIADAQQSYREALDRSPLEWNAAVNLATLYKMQGKMTEAVSVLEAANKANDKIPSLNEMLANYKSEAAATAKG